ncbi:MAG: DUF448 domain-containing protein [Deltaproteobacteria bacterium]|nr:DUF448 domain-containing protein [Deltaproteobacteria bacterium]
MMVEHEREGREAAGKAPPRRLCAGCGKRDLAEGLVRVVLGPEGEIGVDLAGGRFGRGAHVHATTDCVAKAAKGGLSKAFKTRVEAKPEDIGAQIATGAARRIDGLLAGARRGKLAIAGADVVREALRDGSAKKIIVATDAAAATRLPEIEEAIRLGNAIAYGDKAKLGALFGRDEVAVIAVLDQGVAEAIGSVRIMALPFAGLERAWSSEVR